MNFELNAAWKLKIRNNALKKIGYASKSNPKKSMMFSSFSKMTAKIPPL